MRTIVEQLVGALENLRLTAVRYLPDYDEHSEIQCADTALAAGRAALEAPEPQAQGVPPGYVLVPVEPTEVMCEAAMSSLGWTRSEAAAKTAPITPASPMMEWSMKVWSAMLAAAPAARVDDRVQRLIDEARRCAGSTGDLSDLRAALMPFEGDY